MTYAAGENSPLVVLRVADEAARRRIDHLIRARGLEATGIAAVVDVENVDCVLPAGVSDDALCVAVELSIRLAASRRQLVAAHRNEHDLVKLAATDPLTGLPNRRSWDDALDRVSRETATRDEPLCVALLDLDEFKRVNDLHGHAVGDAVLRATADGLRSAVRRDDTAARLGGDEFGLLLPGLPPDHAVAVVERIRRSVHAAIVEAGLPATTCSVGYCTASQRPYIAASSALRLAKQLGRNRSETAS